MYTAVLLGCICFYCGRLLAVEQSPIFLDATLDRLNVSSNISFFVDDLGTRRIEDILRPPCQHRFHPYTHATFNLGIEPRPIWLRIRVENTSDIPNWVLELENPRLGSAQFFDVSATGIHSRLQTGASFPKANREFLFAHPAFSITPTQGSEQTYYIRVQHSGALFFKVCLWQPSAFQAHIHRRMIRVFALAGALLAIALYSLCIWLVLRERVYLHHAVMSLLFILFSMARNGTGPIYWWPNTPWFTDHAVTFFSMLLLCEVLIFSKSILKIRETVPPVYLYLNTLILLSFCTAFLGLTDFPIKYYLAHALGVIAPISCYIAGLLALRNGYLLARSYLITWSIVVFTGVLLALMGAGVVNQSYLMEYALDLSFVIAGILWCFPLFNRLRVREEHAKKRLEQAVTVRTADLRQALDEVKTLHGLLPICSHCKKIRDDRGYWEELETYLEQHTEVDFSHSLCPSCLEALYPEYAPEVLARCISSKKNKTSS